MSTNEDPATQTAGDRPDATDEPTRGADDERLTRQHIAETGEPERDALGNADGAS